MKGSWEVRLDADRTVRLVMDASFKVAENKANADAGETDVIVTVSGSITATNVSDGRNTDGTDFTLEVMAPIETCPDWKRTLIVELGDYCSRDVVKFGVPDLRAGESQEIDLERSDRVASVLTEEAATVMEGMVGDRGVVVSAHRVFWNSELEELNPTCNTAAGATWITYFTEDASVTTCATEP